MSTPTPDHPTCTSVLSNPTLRPICTNLCAAYRIKRGLYPDTECWRQLLVVTTGEVGICVHTLQRLGEMQKKLRDKGAVR